MTDILRPAEPTLPVDVSELDYIPCDFADLLADGETIASASRTLESPDSTDASASSRLVGAAEISGTVVRQFVEGVVEGASYLLRVVATTSDNSRRVVIAVTFRGVRVA